MKAQAQFVPPASCPADVCLSLHCFLSTLSRYDVFHLMVLHCVIVSTVLNIFIEGKFQSIKILAVVD